MILFCCLFLYYIRWFFVVYFYIIFDGFLLFIFILYSMVFCCLYGFERSLVLVDRDQTRQEKHLCPKWIYEWEWLAANCVPVLWGNSDSPFVKPVLCPFSLENDVIMWCNASGNEEEKLELCCGTKGYKPIRTIGVGVSP